MPSGFLQRRLALQQGRATHALSRQGRLCLVIAGAACNGIRLPELTGVCIFRLCDRTPKPKPKEEPDREGRAGAQAEMNEGDEKVKTESWFLKCRFLSLPMWLGHRGGGTGLWVQLLPYLPMGRLWEGYLIPLVGIDGYHCMSVNVQLSVYLSQPEGPVCTSTKGCASASPASPLEGLTCVPSDTSATAVLLYWPPEFSVEVSPSCQPPHFS